MVARAYYDSDTDRVISDVPFVFKQPLTVSGSYSMVDSASSTPIFTIDPDASTQWYVARPTGYDGTTFWEFNGGYTTGNSSYVAINGSNTGEMGILFGDNDDVSDGWVRYDNTNRDLIFGTANNTRARISSVGNFLLGTSTDDGPAMQIFESTSGRSWSPSGSTELIVERGGACYISIVGNGGDTTLNFGDAALENVGRVQYEHDNEIMRFYVGSSEQFRVTTSGVIVYGSISKSSGSFKIDHPLKPDTHHLVHSFVEAPQADNIYRGRVTLVNGTATVNVDQAARMTDGTFVALNGNVQCFTSNETGWTAVRGIVLGNTLTIEAQDPNCTDTISWLVIGERHDSHMIHTDWTDENGRVITEPEK